MLIIVIARNRHNSPAYRYDLTGKFTLLSALSDVSHFAEGICIHASM